MYRLEAGGRQVPSVARVPRGWLDEERPSSFFFFFSVGELAMGAVWVREVGEGIRGNAKKRGMGQEGKRGEADERSSIASRALGVESS